MEQDPLEEFDIFDIDLTMLDAEWIRHPKMFFEYSVKVTKSARKVAEAKAELSLVESELASRMRKNPKKYGFGPKATEAAIKSKIPSRKKWKKYFDLLNDSIENHGILQDVVTALDHRRRGLERLVSLHGQNYFSEPRPLDERSKEIADKIVKTSVRMAGRKRKRNRDD